MVSETAKLLEEALKLPQSERAELAGRLLETLDPDGDEEWSRAWDEEILERIHELETGAVVPVRWPQARDLIVGERDESSGN